MSAGSRPRRIAIVSDSISPYHKGGKEVRYRELAPRLVAAGFEVHLYTMQWWDGPRHKLEDGIHYHALCRYHPLYTGDRRSVVEAVMFSLACLRLLWCRFDVIEADQMPYLQLLPLGLVAKVKRKRLVITWHEVWGRAYWCEYFGWRGWIGAAIERIAMWLPSRVVVESAATRERLVERGVSDDIISMIPVGIDATEIEAAPAAGEHFDVLSVGRLIEHKRIDELLQAIAVLGHRGHRVSCGIVGQGPEEDRLRELATSLGLADQVRFLGNVDPHAAVYGLMKSAGVFVLASVREGFGIVVLESLLCGTPVITSDHRDNHAQALVSHGVNGWVCPPDRESLASAIERVLDAGAALRPDASALRAEYDWGHLMPMLTAVYGGVFV